MTSKRTSTLIFSMFAFFGVAFGTWLVLLADVQATYSLSNAALGAALTGGLVVSVPVMLLTGRAADRWGTTVVIGTSCGLIALSMVCAALSRDYISVVFTCLLFYASTSAFEVGINTAAVSFEQASKQQVMSYFHAGFSGLAALAALTVGGLLSLEVRYQVAYLLVALLALAFCFLVWRGAGLIPTAAHHLSSAPPPLPRRSSPVIAVLAAIAALAFMSEGEMGNWAAIYIRSSLELPALAGSSGFAVFHLSMFTGRLAGARAVKLWGRTAVLQIAGTCVAAGMALTLLSTSMVVVLAGILVVGLALSVVTPTVYSLAGDVAGEHAGAVTSTLTTVGYSGYLFGPILVGGIAEVLSLKIALVSIAVAGIGIAMLSTFLLGMRVPVKATLLPVNVPEQDS